MIVNISCTHTHTRMRTRGKREKIVARIAEIKNPGELFFSGVANEMAGVCAKEG